MLTVDESIIELRKHLKKLSNVIENNASFTFFKVKVVDKNRIDDILCCIEATFPDEYKKLLKQKQTGKYKSISLYHSLRASIQRKFIFSSEAYLIRYKDAQSFIAGFSVILEQDIKFLYNNL